MKLAQIVAMMTSYLLMQDQGAAGNLAQIIYTAKSCVVARKISAS